MKHSRGASSVALLLALAAALAFAACGTDRATDGTPAGQRDPNQRYKATATVLESPSHGPQLCLGGVATSYPPQCGGPDIAGWDWDAVADKEAANGTTWAEVTVVGTFDGSTFTLVERPQPAEQPQAPNLDFSPICSDPEGDASATGEMARLPEHPDLITVWVSSDEHIYNVLVRPGSADAVRREIRTYYSGLLCIAERDQPTQASLRAIQDRVPEEAKGSPLGGVFSVSSDGRRGLVVIECALADDVSKAWAKDHWGDNIELVGALVPVD